MQDFDWKPEDIHIGRLIQIFSHRLRRKNCITNLIDDDGLTSMQKHVLGFILLETLHREIYQKDIEEEFQVRKSSVTGMLQLLEKNGFINRESVQKDARLKRIIPTPKAKALRQSILEHINETETKMTSNIPKEDVLTCKKVLCLMLKNISENEKEACKKHE